MFNKQVHLMEFENHQKKIHDKATGFNLKRQIGKLNLILNFKTVKGPLYILIMLELYRLSKEDFLHELQLGQEVFIP
jgi:hypothetical protein